jgi:hypothetical protein
MTYTNLNVYLDMILHEMKYSQILESQGKLVDMC